MKKFFADDTGKFSMMRLKTLLLALVGCFIAVYQTVKSQPIDHFIVMEFIGLSLGFKIWQKQIEQKSKA